MVHRKLPTFQALVAIGVILAKQEKSKQEETYGFEIVKAAGLSPGSLYPMLSRLVKSGILMSREEEGCPKKSERPLRVYYRLTEKGEKFGKHYKLDALAANPPLVPFEEFS